jgi:hypothetical protein
LGILFDTFFQFAGPAADVGIFVVCEWAAKEGSEEVVAFFNFGCCT